MILFAEEYKRISAISKDMKDRAIASGNSALIIPVKEDSNQFVDKIYSNPIIIYGEKAVQYSRYPDGIYNECVMSRYVKTHNYRFTPSFEDFNTSQLRIRMEYLYDYITLNEYMTREGNDIIIIFPRIFKLLSMMKEENFVHGNLELHKIMIHPNTLDMRVIDLKYSYLRSHDRDISIFHYERNHLFYEIFRKLHPEYSSLLMKYFKIRNPDYYTKEGRKIGEFYSIAISNLYDESIESTNNIEDVYIAEFLHRFIQFREDVFNMNPYSS
jgi:hypothetical protein